MTSKIFKSSNGVDETHLEIPAPEAPSFMAMDKTTGKVLWTDNSPGKNILHGQWSCPAVGVFADVPQVLFPGGDGWLYSFRADRWNNGKPELLWKFDANPKDSQWLLGGRGTRNSLIAVPVIYDGLVYVAVGQDPEHGDGEGHLWCIDPTKRGDVSAELVFDSAGEIVPHRRVQAIAWEKICTAQLDEFNDYEFDHFKDGDLPKPLRDALVKAGFPIPDSFSLQRVAYQRMWWLRSQGDGEKHRCRLEVTQQGPPEKPTFMVTVEGKINGERVVPNPNSALVWHYDRYDLNGDGTIAFEEQFYRTISSPTIKNDLLVIPNLNGLLHCVNAKTGIPYWTYDMFAGCWVTPLIVENKAYVGDEEGYISIFDLSVVDEGFLIDKINMDNNSVYTVPIVANTVLYIATRSTLYAIQDTDGR